MSEDDLLNRLRLLTAFTDWRIVQRTVDEARTVIHDQRMQIERDKANESRIAELEAQIERVRADAQTLAAHIATGRTGRSVSQELLDTYFWRPILARAKAEAALAPEGKLWVCHACGKAVRDRYGQEGGWDESCMLNSVLYDESRLTIINSRVVAIDAALRETKP